MKRGGDAVHLSLDFHAAETELFRAAPQAREIASPESMEEFFEKEWVRSLFSLAVEALKAECEAAREADAFPAIRNLRPGRRGATRASYDDLAREFGIAVTDVTNHLSFARREFRRIALEKLREMCASDDEFRREARAIFGVDPA